MLKQTLGTFVQRSAEAGYKPASPFLSAISYCGIREIFNDQLQARYL